MKIPITFLGTSGAVPTATRNHIGIYLQYKTEYILIDCGEGIQRQIRKAGLNPCKLTKILLTHHHGDHVFGIPGLLKTLQLNSYQKTLEIYGPKGTKKLINDIIRTFNIKKDKIKVKVFDISKKVFENSDFKITALPLQHKVPTLGYLFQENDKLRIHKDKLKKLKIKDKSIIGNLTKGKDIKVDKKTIKSKGLTYLQKGRKILDTKLCPNIKALAKDSDLTIIESTFLSKEDQERAEEYYHLTAIQAATIAKQSKVKQLILTHFSQRYEHKEKLFEKTAKKIFKNTIISKDLMKIEI